MKKLLVAAAILLVVGFVVAKNRHVCSYVSTGCKMMSCQFKNSLSPEFEIERLRGEIAKLDTEVDRLIQDEATLAVDLKGYRSDLVAKETALARSEESLLNFAKEVKANPDKGFVFVKTSFAPTTAKKKLADDFDLYKSQKASVQSLKNLVAAKEKQYTTLVNQRTKIATTKLTFQAQLDQLAADYATLKNDSNSSSPNFDANQITLIEKGLKDLKRKVDIESYIAEKKADTVNTNGVTMPEVGNNVDPDVVLDAITNPGTEKSTVKTPNGQE